MALHKTTIPPQETAVGCTFSTHSHPFLHQLIYTHTHTPTHIPSRTSQDTDPLTKCHPSRPTTPPWRPPTGTPPPSQCSHPQPPTALAPSASGNLQSLRHPGVNMLVVRLRPLLARTQTLHLLLTCQSPQLPASPRTFRAVVLGEGPYPSSPGRSWGRLCLGSSKVAGRCMVPRGVRPGALARFQRRRKREGTLEFSSGYLPGHL